MRDSTVVKRPDPKKRTSNAELKRQIEHGPEPLLGMMPMSPSGAIGRVVSGRASAAMEASRQAARDAPKPAESVSESLKKALDILKRTKRK